MANSLDADASVGYRPIQNIPENQKDREWAIRNVNWCISVSPMYWKNAENSLYDLYNGVWSDEDYASISKTYGVEYPAGKIKHIPLIRPLLNVIEGEYEERNLDFSVRSDDTDSVNARKQEVATKLLDGITRAIKSGEDMDVSLNSLEKYYKQTYQTSLEIAAHHAISYYIKAHHTDRDFKDNFVDKIITGKHYYKVHINRIGEDPQYKTIKPGQLYFSNNNVKWVKECDWAVHPERMSPTQVLDAYGERMEPEDRRKVEDWIDTYYRDSYKLNSANEVDDIMNDTEDWSNSYASDLGMLTVYHVEWKSIRKVYFVENPNPYVEGAPFVKYIPEDKLHTLSGEKRKNLKVRFIEDLWTGLRIGDDIFVDLGRLKYAVRNLGTPSKVYLSFNGPTYSGKIKPYSLIKETKDLQKLYNILHYHKENLIAISGTRGMVMDASQIPDFGGGDFTDNLKMWMYYKKLGVAWIDRSQEGVDRTFNQFGTYDDTLGAGMQAILAMITHIEDLAGRIVGVNRQRMGAMYQRDGKSTTENALMQSALATAPLFAEQDELERQAIEDILNACKVAWKNGYTAVYTSDSFMQEMFTWDPNFSLNSFNVYVSNTQNDKKAIEEMKAFAFNLTNQGMMEFQDIMPLFRKSNLKDIQSQIDVSMQRKKQEMEAKQAEAAKLEQQIVQAKTTAELEKLQAEVNKLYAEAEEIVTKASLDRDKLEQQKAKDKAEIELDRAKLAAEKEELAGAMQAENAGRLQSNLKNSKEIKD